MVKPSPIRERVHIPVGTISESALGVVRELRKKKHQAFLVGGCVRDLLLGLRPKDFDVATSAKPDQVRRIFRRARIIGRRFRIVQVRINHEIFEVTTFRGAANGPEVQKSDLGVVLRDNTYGTMMEDALRRDMTINALYLDPERSEVIDFCGGLLDLRNRYIRIIGDPVVRFREDPVRILRAIRFSARLQFPLHQGTDNAIQQTAILWREISPTRAHDEIFKLLGLGDGLACWHLLEQLDILKQLIPPLDEQLQSAAGAKTAALMKAALHMSDEQVQHGRKTTRGLIVAAMFWHRAIALSRCEQYDALGLVEAMERAGRHYLIEIEPYLRIPPGMRRLIQAIWSLQPRLERHRHPNRITRNPGFPAAVELLELRRQSGEDIGDSSAWWQRYLREHPPLVPKPARFRHRRRRH